MKVSGFFKRSFGILLLCALSLGVAQQPVTITYWTLFTGGDKEFMDAMVEAFTEENPDIVVDQTTAKWENYYDFLTTAMAGGNAPDVAIIHMTAVPGFASQGALHPLDEALSEVGMSSEDFLAVPWERSTYDGVQYAVPLDVHPLVFFYNRELFEGAGLLNEDGTFTQPEDRQGWIDAFQTLKEGTDAAPYPLASLGSAAYREWFSLLYQNGGQLLSDDGTQAAFNSPEGLDALQFWVDHVREYNLP